MNPTLRALVLLALGLTLAGGPLFGAAEKPAKNSKKNSAPKDESAPQLVSTTGGGGGGWSDVKELTQASDKGNPVAMMQLGELKLQGDQVPKDVPAGIALLQKAAQAGQGPAAFRLGKTYDDGLEVPQDRERAFAYYRAAAAAGVGEAFFNLGASYASGRGVKRDYAEGLAWLILAKQHGVTHDGEKQLRERLTSVKRTDLITAGEKRALEIAKELAEKKITGYLPPAK